MQNLNSHGDDTQPHKADTPGEYVITPFGCRVGLKAMTQQPPHLMVAHTKNQCSINNVTIQQVIFKGNLFLNILTTISIATENLFLYHKQLHSREFPFLVLMPVPSCLHVASN